MTSELATASVLDLCSPNGILDRSALVARIGDDAALLRELVGVFLEDCPGWLRAIEEGIARHDARHVRLHAHLLGGTASNFGATLLTARARRLEEMAKAGSLTDAAAAHDALLAAVEATLPALRALL